MCGFWTDRAVGSSGYCLLTLAATLPTFKGYEIGIGYSTIKSPRIDYIFTTVGLNVVSCVVFPSCARVLHDKLMR